MEELSSSSLSAGSDLGDELKETRGGGGSRCKGCATEVGIEGYRKSGPT